MRSLTAAAPPGQPPPPRYARGYGAMFSQHIGQADEGCDFDFLAGTQPTAEPEILSNGGGRRYPEYGFEGSHMRLVTFVEAGAERLGFLVGDTVVDPLRAFGERSGDARALFADAPAFIQLRRQGDRGRQGDARRSAESRRCSRATP